MGQARTLQKERRKRMTTINFANAHLTTELMNAIAMMGFKEASPIQQASIPLILEGNDVIGQAQTGTGKTAAFAIPVIEMLEEDNKDIQAIILCPTRELAIQVGEEFNKLMHFKKNLVATTVYGGQPIERQLKALKKGPQIIIGTPGRTMDHLRRGSISLHNLRFVVLDEADEMLNMGFREDIETILKDAPQERQTILFSATMPREIIKLTKQYQQNPLHIDVTDKKKQGPKIEQLYYEVKEKNKLELLVRLLDQQSVKRGLVFCNTKSQVDKLVELLKDRDYFADALHGDMNQNQRDKVMNGFRKGTVEILVATDVAGRGIDVNNLEAVFNFDLPRDDEDYIHRIGRTARAGKSGVAISFVTSNRQIQQLKKIERLNGSLIKMAKPPEVKDVKLAKIKASADKIRQLITANDQQDYVSHIESLIDEENTALDLAAALLKLSVESGKTSYDPSIDFDNQIDPAENKEKYAGRRNRAQRRFKRDTNNDYRPRKNRTEGKNDQKQKSRKFGNERFVKAKSKSKKA